MSKGNRGGGKAGVHHHPNDLTRRAVADLTGIGYRQAEVSQILQISEPTLRAHYRYELDCGAMVTNANVARSLYETAIGGDVNAQKFWLACRAGWRDRSPIEETADRTLRIVIEGGLPDFNTDEIEPIKKERTGAWVNRNRRLSRTKRPVPKSPSQIARPDDGKPPGPGLPGAQRNTRHEIMP